MGLLTNHTGILRPCDCLKTNYFKTLCTDNSENEIVVDHDSGLIRRSNFFKTKTKQTTSDKRTPF